MHWASDPPENGHQSEGKQGKTEVQGTDTMSGGPGPVPVQPPRCPLTSIAVGGEPMMCRPQGSRRDSISISLRYTLPTMLSRSSMVRVYGEQQVRGKGEGSQLVAVLSD